MIEQLRKQGVSDALLRQVEAFVSAHPFTAGADRRPDAPRFTYYGRAVWEQAIAGILSGANILLVGPKATGKNVLSENLSFLFNRPSWNISFHINTDASSLIGTDTFKNGEVVFRRGPIAECAIHGGFGILDEINMARNDAIAVLHASLDHRRLIDLPGYEPIRLQEATRFIATMNYGYIGTRELNEALTSRFLVIRMPAITPQQLDELLALEFPALKAQHRERFSALFDDLQLKSRHAEISTKPVDLRGLLAAIHLMERGLMPEAALTLGLVNKSFDDFEQEIVRDSIALHIPKSLRAAELFEG